MNANEAVSLREIVRAEIYRALPGGYAPPEGICVGDLITTAGRVFLANRIASNVGSPMAYMAVGTVTTAATLTDTALTGEVLRKALSTASVLAGQTFTAVMTLGGAADSVTSLSIAEAGILNHANSGNGTLFQRVTFTPVVLANSDLLKLTLETNVGSN